MVSHWDAASLQCSSIWNCKNICRVVADVCKIVVGPGEVFNEKTEIYKISGEVTKYTYKNYLVILE